MKRSVSRGEEQEPKTSARVRTNRLSPRLIEALRRHRELSHYTQPKDYIFTNGAGNPLDPDDLRKRVLYPAMDKVGVQRTTPRAFDFHIFRHTPGSEFTEATGNLKKTQSFLGHSSIKTTADAYAHLQPDAELDAMQTIEEVIFFRIVLNCSQLGSNGEPSQLRATTLTGEGVS